MEETKDDNDSNFGFPPVESSNPIEIAPLVPATIPDHPQNMADALASAHAGLEQKTRETLGQKMLAFFEKIGNLLKLKKQDKVRAGADPLYVDDVVEHGGENLQTSVADAALVDSVKRYEAQKAT